jgi:hypothetical protein
LSSGDNNATEVDRLATVLRRGGLVMFCHERSAAFLSNQLKADSIATGFRITRLPNMFQQSRRCAEKCE